MTHESGDGPILPVASPIADPRAFRVSLGAATAPGDPRPIVVAPAPEAIQAAAVRFAGTGPLGGVAAGGPAGPGDGDDRHGDDGSHDGPRAQAVDAAPAILVDGLPVRVALTPVGRGRATLVEIADDAEIRHRVVVPGPGAVGADGVLRRELVVDGWRVEVEVESERRAALRERARRGHESAGHGGPTEVHAIIPGRVVSVSVTPGDELTAGQQILVVEAMKMQNELRSPRDGTVRSVAVGPGTTIEVGDLLLVIE